MPISEISVKKSSFSLFVPFENLGVSLPVRATRKSCHLLCVLSVLSVKKLFSAAAQLPQEFSQ